MFSFGGHGGGEEQGGELLRYYRFNFHQSEWTPLQKKEMTPVERFWHTTVQLDGTLYLYGGSNRTTGFSDIWKYRGDLDRWTEIQQAHPQSRCGHTSTITTDGKMIVLGGFDCSITSFSSPKDKLLYPLSSASIFNTVTTQWYDQPLIGSIPSDRTFHTAVKSNVSEIVICGGQDARVEPFQTYISGKQMSAVLDINEWKWTRVPMSHYQPPPTSFSIATIVNHTNMVYGLGLNSHSAKDGIYVLDTLTQEWIPPTRIGKGDLKPTRVPTSAILFLVLLAVILSLILSIFWILRKYKVHVFQSLKKSVWNPRAGEPLWAEMSRFIFRSFFFAVFMMMSVILLVQVQDSPMIDQVHRDEHTTVLAPHLRFCFDGWKSVVLQCTTNFGGSCNEHLEDMTPQVQGNLNYYGYALTCYLFKADTLLLGPDRWTSQGTSLQFYYYGETLNQSIVHVESYPPLHDPNLPVYGLSGEFDGWYTADENAKFQASEQGNLKTQNVFHLESTRASQIGYRYGRREKMDRSLWNLIGFGTRREMVHDIETVQYQTTTMDVTWVEEEEGSLPLVGSLHVFPTSYHTKVMREQRAFTVIGGMGMIGGIFGLMIGFQASVFGYRPRSPWGIVHRWTVGWMRKSLLDGLRARFSKKDLHIPIVHPIHHGKEEEHRMAKLEERLHVFEFLFQAYYIDDEVFRSLGNSSSGNGSNGNGSGGGGGGGGEGV
ncbi:uncharacterized protein EV154DRAFT_424098 [Mucor mucedo]|uniref:uncharacterized protein n=1 Tax=Mucor mucedo TaxID=29922 RepID=UPI0022205C96|nr:uncharacterized protein EV154DRAFT_424098 [Mucor mucedo]KAI7889266.1 hypothetical protein EV154DRAFT_424098 [Mucor mucedo]